jgi:hypothetical protein
VVVQIEIIGAAAREARCPALRNVNEQDIELRPPGVQALHGPQQSVGQDRMRRCRGCHVILEVRVDLDAAAASRCTHMQPEHPMEARPLRQILASLGGHRGLIELAYERKQPFALAGRSDRRNSDRVWH